MIEPDRRRYDRLSPHTLHELITLLTAIRGQEHMVRRWVRLRDTTDGFEKTLERLSVTDTLIQRIVGELVACQVDDDGEEADSH